jgi:hypothetical protein
MRPIRTYRPEHEWIVPGAAGWQLIKVVLGRILNLTFANLPSDRNELNRYGIQIKNRDTMAVSSCRCFGSSDQVIAIEKAALKSQLAAAGPMETLADTVAGCPSPPPVLGGVLATS